jgi:copper chaperone CopZ
MPCSKNSQEGTNANAKGCCSSTGNQTETPPGTRTVVHHNHNHNDNDNDKNYSNDAINSKSGSSCCNNTNTTTNGNGNGKDGSKSSSSSCSSNIKDNDKDNGNSNGKSNGNHTDDHTSNHHNHGHNHNHGHDHNHGHGHGHNHCSGNKNNSNQTQTHATKQVNEPSDNGNVVPCCSNNNGNDNANDNANAKESTSTRTRNHDKPDCIAILRENGHVDVYDVNGQVKSFSSDKNANTTTATATVPTATPSATATKSAVDPNNICFSSHGHDVDEFLTPCFDELGQHGDPEEGCFCGIDTPHLHAHVHNDKTCIDHDDHDHDKNDVSRLSQLTFHPVEYDSNSNSKQDQHQHQYQYQPLIESESMPNACNAQELKSKLNRTDGNRNRKDYRNANNNVFQIRHDQHVDTLVHNSNNGNLMLEHDCGDCGDHDVHGTLELVSKREWNRNHPSNPNPNSSSNSNPNSVARTRTRMHFYTIPKTPLRLLDLLADFFAMDEDKASILRNAFPPCPKRVSRRPCCPPPPCCTEGTCSTGTGESDVDVEQLEAGVEQAVAGSGAGTGTVRTSGKSSFFVSGICCASEIPAINSILDPLNGVDKVTINVTNKTVYVYHQFELMSAQGIKAVLDAEKFDARITKDAGAVAFFLGQPEDSNLRIRAIADCQRVLCASPDYIAQRGAPTNGQELIDGKFECLNLRFPGAAEFQWRLMTKDGPRKFAVKGRLESDDGDVLTDWALDGQGIALKPVFEVAEHLKSGRLVPVADETPPVPIQMACLFTHKRHQDPKTRLFMEFMTEKVRAAVRGSEALVQLPR